MKLGRFRFRYLMSIHALQEHHEKQGADTAQSRLHRPTQTLEVLDGGSVLAKPLRAGGAVPGLVERFDIEPFSDFSAK